MQRWWTLAIVAALIVAHRYDGRPDAPSDAQRPAFRGGVDVVALNVTVTDGSRRYVTDLEPQDFLVFEDGRQQDT